MKKLFVLLIALVLLGTTFGNFAMAAPNDILSIDGKTGKIYLTPNDNGYNYSEKYLYDVNFSYAQSPNLTYPTLKEVLQFLSTDREGVFTPRVDIDSFINSALGERTAQIWYHYIMWYDEPMAEGLINYWKNLGLNKTAFYDDPDIDDGIDNDYYVYTPVGSMESGNTYPLIVVNRGGGERAYQIETFGLCEVAAREGVILVAAQNNDVTNNDAILDFMIKNYPVDASRIYVVGSSGGARNALAFAAKNWDKIAACALMDQPASFEFPHFHEPTDEEIAIMQEYTFPLIFIGGTADMYGLCGMQDRDFWLSSQGSEPQFISGWNSLMSIYNIEGKDLTMDSRIALADNPSNEAEYYQGYPFDTVKNIDETGTSAVYECSMDGVDAFRVYIVENRAHMPAGYDGEYIWSFFSKFSRNPETHMSETID